MRDMAHVNNASGDGDINNGRKVTAVPTYYGSRFLLSSEESDLYCCVDMCYYTRNYGR